MQGAAIGYAALAAPQGGGAVPEGRGHGRDTLRKNVGRMKLATGNGRIRKVVIAGGGTAGWVAAYALAHQFRDLLDITLIESKDIGTVGVGESTIPTIRTFHRLLQIDEQEFMSATAATFKLSISFENWKCKGDRYFHPFGTTGVNTWSVDFHQFWLESRRRGIKSELGDYCLETAAALKDRFALFNTGQNTQQWSMRWTKAASMERRDAACPVASRIFARARPW